MLEVLEDQGAAPGGAARSDDAYVVEPHARLARRRRQREIDGAAALGDGEVGEHPLEAGAVLAVRGNVVARRGAVRPVDGRHAVGGTDLQGGPAPLPRHRADLDLYGRGVGARCEAFETLSYGGRAARADHQLVVAERAQLDAGRAAAHPPAVRGTGVEAGVVDGRGLPPVRVGAAGYAGGVEHVRLPGLGVDGDLAAPYRQVGDVLAALVGEAVQGGAGAVGPAARQLPLGAAARGVVVVELGGVGGLARLPGQQVAPVVVHEPSVGGDAPGAAGVADDGLRRPGEADLVLAPAPDRVRLEVLGGQRLGPDLLVEDVPVGLADPALEVAGARDAEQGGPLVGEDVLLVVADEADELGVDAA